jgi:hypothetical protein
MGSLLSFPDVGTIRSSTGSIGRRFSNCVISMLMIGLPAWFDKMIRAPLRRHLVKGKLADANKIPGGVKIKNYLI